MASIHATFFADAVVDWLGGRVTEDEALGRYRKLRDDHALAPFEETVTFARDLSSLGAASAPPGDEFTRRGLVGRATLSG
jgi:hypothetical protein